MFANVGIVSLALPLLFGASSAISLDVSNTDSIKSTAKTLANAIVETYNDLPKGSAIGMFDDPYYWWESGAAWNGLVRYSQLTGDSQFDAVVAQALWAQIGDTDYPDFMPLNQTKALGNSDQSTWGMAAMTAAESGFKKPAKGEWVDIAKNVFDEQVLRWDESSCGGGLRWQIFSFNNGYSYKNSISTGNFFLLSARLAQFTGNQTYVEWADKSFKWLQDVKLLSEKWAVYDGTSLTTGCSTINHVQFSYPFGTLVEGAAIMYNLTNGNSTWKSAVSGFAEHVSVFQDNSTSVLYEVACETNDKCDVDQRAFKGLAARSLARAAVAAPFVADTFNDIIKVSAKAAAATCDGEGKDTRCGKKWYEENDDAEDVEDGGLGEILSALEVVQGLLYSDAKDWIAGNETATPTGTSNPSASGTGAPSGTGTAEAASSTGAAGKRHVALGGLAVAGLFAVMF